MKNNYANKLVRTFTSVLPIGRDRKGSCKRCGECCKLPNKCLFLDFDSNKKAICKIYNLRPLNCRKYPRALNEHVTHSYCGYFFENGQTQKED